VATPQKKHTKPPYSRQALTACMALCVLFEANNLAVLVFRSLDLYSLLKVSMASRQARSLVDVLGSNLFAYSTPFDLVSRTQGQEQPRLEFD
jgi:hypothetical protein